MAESQSPIICVTCHREFPDDLDAEKSPRYFVQSPLLPKTDDAYDFGCEVQRMLGYIKAISDALRYGDNKEVQPETYDTIFELVGEISEEALRRLRISRLKGFVRWRSERMRQRKPPTRERYGCRHVTREKDRVPMGNHAQEVYGTLRARDGESPGGGRT
jgi:hypothetical protein